MARLRSYRNLAAVLALIIISVFLVTGLRNGRSATQDSLVEGVISRPESSKKASTEIKRETKAPKIAVASIESRLGEVTEIQTRPKAKPNRTPEPEASPELGSGAAPKELSRAKDGRQLYHQRNQMNPEYFHTLTKDSDPAKAEKIKEAFMHVWRSYKKNAWGNDTLKPLTQKGENDWNGWGVTLVDSLDTMLLMGLDDEYEKALGFVKNLDFTKADKQVAVFETVIRYLGGLLGAYDLRPNDILLKKATVLADQLMFAIKENTHFPAFKLDFNSHETIPSPYGPHHSTILLAEIGTIQLEFHRLSQLTGNWSYAEAAQKVIDTLQELPTEHPGLYPIYYDFDTGAPADKTVSFGAMGDSFYEYLLKRYLLTNKTEEQYKKMYINSIAGLKSTLINQLDGPHHLMMLGQLSSSGSYERHMDHLSCFVPGMLALSAVTLDRPDDFKYSQELLNTCHYFYEASPSHISPEALDWSSSPHYDPGSTFASAGLYVSVSKSYLRPETLESIFYAYRTTGDPIYREWAWQIFLAFEEHCQVPGGFAALNDVTRPPTYRGEDNDDYLQSFFLAETLKYFYLIFMPSGALDLNQYVLTTEAHPLRISTITQPK